MKLDLMKAYDQLEWSFIDKALNAWGFSKETRKLIVSCVSTVEYTMLINGRISKVVKSIKN